MEQSLLSASRLVPGGMSDCEVCKVYVTIGSFAAVAEEMGETGGACGLGRVDLTTEGE